MATNASKFTVANLKALIRSAGRIVGGDSARQDAIAKAAELSREDFLPDGWSRDDGSLIEGNGGAWTDEQRDTANDMFAALDAAVGDMCDGLFPSYCVWVKDWFGSSDDDANPYTVVYYAGNYDSGDIYACPFSFDADSKVVIDIEDAIKVRPVTDYIPRSQRAADDPCPTCHGAGKRDAKACDDCGGSGEQRTEKPKRSLVTRTLEWRSQRAPKRGDTDHRNCAAPLELREADDGGFTLTSYASLFNVPYTVGSGSFRYEETVYPTAFKRTLNNAPNVVFRTEHSNAPLGRTTAETLRLSSDERGLRYEVDLNPDDPDVKALVPKIQRKDYNESSFAFRVIEDTWDDSFSARGLKACDLDRGDVSIVTFGASPQTGDYMTLRNEQSLLALRLLDPSEFVEAWVEWRDHTLVPFEQRAGKALSASTMEVLSKVLDLVSSADDAVDEAQPLLADLMGVPNPDTDEPAESDEDDGEQETNASPAPGESTAGPVVIFNRVLENQLRMRAMQARSR